METTVVTVIAATIAAVTLFGSATKSDKKTLLAPLMPEPKYIYSKMNDIYNDE